MNKYISRISLWCFALMMSIGLFTFVGCKGNNDSVDRARQMINTVVTDMGWNNKQASASSVEYQDYNEESLDYYDEYYSTLAKVFLMWGKAVLDNDTFKFNVCYKSEASFMDGENRYDGEGMLCGEMKGDDFYLYVRDCKASMTMTIKLTASENLENWSMVVFAPHKSLTIHNGFGYLTVNAENSKPYQAILGNVEITENATELKSDVISSLVFHDCNLKTHKKLTSNKSNFNDTDLVAKAQEIQSVAQSNIPLAIEDMEAVSSTFLHDAYVMLGYNTVE